jgi:ABC-type uncharacterized transport system substrate-binding protein
LRDPPFKLRDEKANMTISTRLGDNGVNKFVARVAVFALSLALLMVHSTLYAQDSAKRVLFLLSYNISYPGIMMIGQGAITRLTDRSPEKLELLSEFLDLARFPEPDQQSRTAAYLAAKYAGRRPDVVITAGGEASQFIFKHRDVIAPGVPIVVCCLPADAFAALGGSAKITGVISRRDISKTLDLAERLQPGARNLVVIAGMSAFDQQWVQIARQQIEGRKQRHDRSRKEGCHVERTVDGQHGREL